MSRDIKRMFESVKVYPSSVSKDAFLKRFRKVGNVSQKSSWDMIFSQVGYIKMPVWIVSLLTFIVGAVGLSAERNDTFVVAAMMPFVSGIAVMESFRGEKFGMTELEGVTLYSRRGALFARLVCVGISHICLLFVLSILIGLNGEGGLFTTGSILTIPYLISSIVNMELERTQIGKKIYPGFGFSAALSIATLFLKEHNQIFNYDYRFFWYLLTLILIVMQIKEIKKSYFVEEYVWN